MKKIYALFSLLICTAAHGARTPWGQMIENNFYTPKYMISAADAWDSVIGAPWRGGRIAAQMDGLYNSYDEARLFEVLGTLAYNHTTMTISQSRQYLNHAFDVIDGPLMSRRGGAAQKFVVSGRGFGEFTDFDANNNNNFEFRTGGGTVRAYAYVADGYAFGVGYTYADSRSHDMPLDVDAKTHIISMFSKYLSQNGFYINSALAAGQTGWDMDKRAVGVKDDISFNTDLWSGQINTGIHLQRGKMFIRPQLGARYSLINTEHFTDAAAQSFKKWWYNTLTTGGSVNAGIRVAGDGFTATPHIMLGAGYDIIHTGTDQVRVRVLSGKTYHMPVMAPGRTMLYGGAGVGMNIGTVHADIGYRLDSQSDFIAHNFNATIKITF